MRGKQSKAASGRHAANLKDAINRTRAELAAEQALLADIKAEELEIDRLRERLATATAAREAAVAGELVQLGREAELLRAETVLAEAAADRIHERWEPAMDSLVQILGGRVRGLELFMRIVVLRSGSLIDNRLQKLGNVRAQQIEVARGQRHRVNEVAWDKPYPPRPLRGMLHPHLNEVFEAEAKTGVTAPADAVAAAEAVQHATWTTATLDALYTWHPFPWTVQPYEAGSEHPVAAALGFTDSVARWELPPRLTTAAAIEPSPTAALSAVRRQHLAQQSPRKVIDAWQRYLTPSATVQKRWPLALCMPPLHPTSADAAAVKHWHTLSALGQWATSEAISPEHSYAAGSFAIAMAAAPVYWLPPTQTFDILDSEPLTDLEDLRLPYPQVMLTFAEPPIIEPWRDLPDKDAVEAGTRAAALIEGTLLTSLRNDPEGPLDVFSTYVSSDPEGPPLVPIWDLLAARGALVEGILLLGDSLGRLTPHAAWALSIPSLGGRYAAQRLLVPMEWEASSWRDQVLNAAAIVAWADWHAPLDPVEGDAVEHQRLRSQPQDDGDDVRILAVRRARVTPNHPGEPTGRTVAAHVRRGHWRRQRHGPGGDQVKRIRIAPTVVNAGQRSFAARVYVLPAVN